jgi:hypothetical protein
VLVIFVLLMGCIGNSMVIYAAVKKKRIRTNFDVLILNLTGSDFITCTFLSPTFLFLLFAEPPAPKMFCGSVLFLGAASGMLSMFTLVAIALHRLARVVGHARGTLSLTRTAIILTIIWILSFRIRFFFTAAYITIEFPIHPIKSTKITSTVHTANEAV